MWSTKLWGEGAGRGKCTDTKSLEWRELLIHWRTCSPYKTLEFGLYVKSLLASSRCPLDLASFSGLKLQLWWPLRLRCCSGDAPVMLCQCGGHVKMGQVETHRKERLALRLPSWAVSTSTDYTSFVLFVHMKKTFLCYLLEYDTLAKSYTSI